MGIETSRTTRGARTTREGVAVRAVRARDGFERRGDARKSDDADGRRRRRRVLVRRVVVCVMKNFPGVCLFIFFIEQCIGCRYAFKR
jgi:hypothetical protein